MKMLFFLKILFFINIVHVSCYGSDENRVLTVGGEYRALALALPGSMEFQFGVLNSNSKYEVLVSFPASMPTYFDFKWKCENSSENSNESRGSMRQLLNTEKNIFETDEKGYIVHKNAQCKDCILQLSARPEGYSSVHPDGRNPLVYFNVALHELHWGIPTPAIRLVLLLPFVFLMTMAVFGPPVKKWFKRLGYIL